MRADRTTLTQPRRVAPPTAHAAALPAAAEPTTTLAPVALPPALPEPFADGALVPSAEDAAAAAAWERRAPPTPTAEGFALQASPAPRMTRKLAVIHAAARRAR